jgi:two-component system sensor histidine kinase UhpB
MSRFLRSLPAQLLLITILPLTLVLAAVAFGSVALHQQSMRQLVSERDMRAVMATSVMLGRVLERRSDGSFNLSQPQFNALINPMPSQRPVTAFLVDASGGVLLHTDAVRVGMRMTDHGGVREALRGEFGVVYQQDSLTSPEHVISYAPITIGGYLYGLILEEPWQEVIDPVMQYSMVAPLVLLPVSIIAVVALILGMRRIVHPLQELERQAEQARVGNVAALHIPVAGIDEITRLQATLQTMTEQIEADNDLMRSYAHAVTEAQEQERKRLARELHDDTIQNLIVLAQRIQLARIAVRPDEAVMLARLDDMHEGVLRMIDDVRRLSGALRPIYLEEAGLTSGLERLVAESNEAARTRDLTTMVHLDIQGEIPRLQPDVEMTLFRIAQEGITNALKHAHAAHIQVHLSHHAGGVIKLGIHDDGRGFDLSTSKPGFGLTGIRERAALIGASVALTSTPGHGTSLVVHLPE